MSDSPSFQELGLDERLLRALADVGYETPSPIQQACIPPLLSGNDLLGEAQTGTGKTAAFALPILQQLDLAKLVPQVLVLTPTRELAIQVAEAFQRYAKHLGGLHVLPVYGGQGMGLQLHQLRRGVHVIVGTPGRVMDHLERGTLVLDSIRTIVLDEADEMLRMGFIDAVEWILEHTPAERQTALFSATMAEDIRRVARTHMREPVEVRIKAATRTVATVHQQFWQVSGTNKLDALTRILEAAEDIDATLVFVRTKTATAELAERLEARGHAAAALNGDMSQQLRERVIDQLKSGELDIVVATDVAARGIDVARVSHVINYDIPYDTEAYVHRIGRTGRAGRTGTAILFVAPREMRMLRTIERVTRQPIEPLRLPSREAVADRRVSRFRQVVGEVIREEALENFAPIVEQLCEEHEGDIARVAAALLYLAQAHKPLHPPGQQEYTPAPAAPAQERSAPRERAERRPREEPSGAHREAPKKRAATALEFPPGADVGVYRIAVGKRHEATPREIVGAIANEAGIGSRYIGRIDIREDFTLIELPAELPTAALATLRRTRVRHQPLEIRRAEGAEDLVEEARSERAPHREARPAGRPQPRFDGASPERRPRKPGGEQAAERRPRSTFGEGARERPARNDGNSPPKRRVAVKGPEGVFTPRDRGPKPDRPTKRKDRKG